MRHGAEPWEELAVKLMLKWPGLYYMTSGFAAEYYPKAIVDYANTRGADKIMYAGYYPMGLSLAPHLRRAAGGGAEGRRVAPVPARQRPPRVLAGRRGVTGVEPSRRIDYAGSVHDEREIDAVVEVLRGGPTALRIGRNVGAMEARVAELFGKRRGVMCNSGSSALYLAVELLGLEPGDEIVTSAVTFSTDIAPMVRAGWCRRSSTSSPTPTRSTSTPSRR